MPRQVTASEAGRPPYSAVGLLEMDFDDGHTYQGTGALIASRWVLTCAHNFVTVAQGTRATAVRFYPAWNSTAPITATTPHVPAVCTFVPPAHMGTDKTLWDIALVYLANPVPQSHYFTMQVVREKGQVPQELNLVGYPGDKNGEMWWDHDEVTLVEPQFNSLFHMHDSFEGSSGSPMFDYHADSDQVRVFAVHTHGANDLKRATLLTPTVVQRIQAVLDAGGYPTAFGVYQMWQ